MPFFEIVCFKIKKLIQERVFVDCGGRWIMTEIENGKKMVSTNGYFVVRERKLNQWRRRNRRQFKGCSLRFCSAKFQHLFNRNYFLHFGLWIGLLNFIRFYEASIGFSSLVKEFRLSFSTV